MFAGSLLLVACVDGTQGPIEDTQLGIAEFVVHEQESQLDILALNAAGHPVGQITLLEGTFELPDFAGPIAARKLTIRVDDKNVEHASPLSSSVQLPLLGDGHGPTDAFLHHPALAIPLARWGVTFQPLTATSVVRPLAALTISTRVTDDSGEAPYLFETCYGGTELSGFEGSSCTGSTFAGGSHCSTGHMYSAGGGLYYDFKACDNVGPYANKDTIAKRACKSGGGSTPCGTAGTNGCAVCWTEGYYCGCGTGAAGACNYSCVGW